MLLLLVPCWCERNQQNVLKKSEASLFDHIPGHGSGSPKNEIPAPQAIIFQFIITKINIWMVLAESWGDGLQECLKINITKVFD
jgi:hypothetical protein